MALRLSMLLLVPACVARPVAVPELPPASERPAAPLLLAGSGVCLPVAALLLPRGGTDDLRLLPSIGSAGALRAIRAGRIDLGLLSRPAVGAERAGLEVVPWLSSAVGLVAREDHPLLRAGRQRIAAVMRQPGPLLPVMREAGDSSLGLLLQAFPAMKSEVEAASRRGVIALTDAEALGLIAEDSRRFGIADLGAAQLHEPPLKPLHHGPSTERKLYLVYRKDAPPAVRRLAAALRQQASERAGELENYGYRPAGGRP